MSNSNQMLEVSLSAWWKCWPSPSRLSSCGCCSVKNKSVQQTLSWKSHLAARAVRTCPLLTRARRRCGRSGWSGRSSCPLSSETRRLVPAQRSLTEPPVLRTFLFLSNKAVPLLCPSSHFSPFPHSVCQKVRRRKAAWKWWRARGLAG